MQTAYRRIIILTIMLAISALAIFDHTPEWTAQYAPLVMLPLLAIATGRSPCCTLGTGRAA